MLSIDERYIMLGDLKQGSKVTFEGKYLMKLPEFCECYNEKSNLIDLNTGAMIWLDPKRWVDLKYMKVEDMNV